MGVAGAAADTGAKATGVDGDVGALDGDEGGFFCRDGTACNASLRSSRLGPGHLVRISSVWTLAIRV